MTRQPRVLIVDDDLNLARTLSDVLHARGFAADRACSADEALRHLAAIPYLCVISDIKMPGTNGVELHRMIRARWPEMPVVLMTAYTGDALIQEGLSDGVVAVLGKPLDLQRLLAALAQLVRQHTLMIVDDDPVFGRTLGDLLRRHGYSVSYALTARAAGDLLTGDVGVVLLDMKLPDGDGVQVLKVILSRHVDAFVVLVTAYGKEMKSSIETALEIGATTCLHKPFDPGELVDVLTDNGRTRLSGLLSEPGNP